MQVVSIISTKGGVGKTTTAANLGGFAADAGLRVLLLDLDVQPTLSSVAGRAERYATRAEACAGIHRALAHTPAKRIDAGLGQVNLGYHAHRYDHPCDLLDPYRNLAIAAEILREQHTPGEDWLVAIGRYHRPAGGVPAIRYRRSVHQHLTRVLGPGASLSTARSPMP